MKIGIIKGQIPADQTILKDDEPAFDKATGGKYKNLKFEGIEV